MAAVITILILLFILGRARDAWRCDNPWHRHPCTCRRHR